MNSTLRRMRDLPFNQFALFVFAVGFALGLLKSPAEIGVEFGQVFGGTIVYPTDGYVGGYYAKTWSIVSQIIALMLRAGLGVTLTSMIVSALSAGVFIEALFLLAYAVCKKTWLSLTGALIIVFLQAYWNAPSYPIDAFFSHTHGKIALGSALLAIGLYANQFRKSAALWLGCLPAIHLTWGIWVPGCLVAALLYERFNRRRAERVAVLPLLVPFLIGAAITLASFLINLILSPMHPVPSALASEAPRYLSTYLRLWERGTGHYHPLPAWQVASLTVQIGSSSALAMILGERLYARRGAAASLALNSVVASGVFSALLMIVVYLLGANLPLFIDRAMPNRYVDLSILLSGILIIAAVLSLQRPSGLDRLLLVAFVLFPISFRILFRILSFDVFTVTTDLIDAAILSAGSGYALYRVRSEQKAAMPAGAAPEPLKLTERVFSMPFLAAICLVAAALVFVVRFVRDNSYSMLPDSQARSVYLVKSDERNFWDSVAQTHNTLLVTGLMYPVQFFARRPIAFYGGMFNYLPYTPELGPWMNIVMKDTFDIDFFSAPSSIVNVHGFAADTGKTVLEERTRAEWLALRDKDHIGAVLTPSGWKLDLPLTAQTVHYSLFSVE